MKLLVTGGAGYIGSVVTAQLLEAGHHVVVLDGGRVVEEGRPAALAEAAGIYAHLYLDDAEAPSRLD